MTENGIFGHANLTHVINDVDIARKYLALHDKLISDPATTKDNGKYQDWIQAETPAPLDALLQESCHSPFYRKRFAVPAPATTRTR
ncbi:MAG: hypothetical protein EOS75_30020 [Mesorhizobium sp.]|nr:MAG: hypothetical protein EOS74_10785 [Mesorhizobium sp.]RWD52216.1 MAG: hypothetical protein EOS75_30020 [Mesorhizobium sp.]